MMRGVVANRVIQGWVSLVLCACLGLGGAGCTTTWKWAGLGGVIGALSGAGTALVVGGDTKDAATVGLIGAVAGATLGGIYGDKLTKKREGFASTASFLDNEIAETRSSRLAMQNDNQRLAAQCAALENEASLLNASYQDAASRGTALADLKKRTASELTAANAQLAKAEETIKYQREGVLQNPDVKSATSQTPQLESEIRALEAAKVELASTVDRLQSLNDRLASL